MARFILIKKGPWLRDRSPISIHDSDIDLPDEKRTDTAESRAA